VPISHSLVTGSNFSLLFFVASRSVLKNKKNAPEAESGSEPTSAALKTGVEETKVVQKLNQSAPVVYVYAPLAGVINHPLLLFFLRSFLGGKSITH